MGTPPFTIENESQTIEFVIHGFKDRPEKRGECLQSPILKAHGHSWKIEVFPKGDLFSKRDTEYVSFYLEYSGNKLFAPEVDFAIRCKTACEIADEHDFRIDGLRLGWRNFIRRDDLLKMCLEENRSLVVEVDISIDPNRKVAWYPKELKREETLVELYDNAASKTRDAIFTVGDIDYYAHTCILSMRSKALFELSKKYKKGTPVPIPNISGLAFQSILDFLYTVQTPDIEDEKTATEILVAADRFDCAQLKLFVESVIVYNFLEASNAADFLVIADAHSCALLKEAAMKIYKTQAKVVRRTAGWAKVEGFPRLIGELLDHISVPHRASIRTLKNVEDLNVASLRNQLQEANLAIDGSHEALIERLKAHISKT